MIYWNQTYVSSPNQQNCPQNLEEIVLRAHSWMWSFLIFVSIRIRFMDFWKRLLVTAVSKYRLVYWVFPFWKIQLNLTQLRKASNRTSIRALCILLHETEQTSALLCLSSLSLTDVQHPFPFSLKPRLGRGLWIGKEERNWELQSTVKGGESCYHQRCLGALLSPLPLHLCFKPRPTDVYRHFLCY